MADDDLSARWAARKAAREAGLQEARLTVRQAIKDVREAYFYERILAREYSLAETLDILADKDTMAAIAEGEADIAAGRVIPFD